MYEQGRRNFSILCAYWFCCLGAVLWRPNTSVSFQAIRFFFFLHCFSLGVVLPGPMCETVRMRPKGASV